MRSFLIICLMLLVSVGFSAQSIEKYKVLSSPRIKEFTEDLNETGKRGFRLIKVAGLPNEFRPVKDGNLFAVLEHDTGQRYEYDWFEAYSPLQLEARINERAKSGFYFKGAIPFLENYCEIVAGTTVDPDATPLERSEALLRDVLERNAAANAISYGGIFIVERKVGDRELRNYKVAADTLAADFLGMKGSSSELLRQHLEIVIREGFQPVSMMSLRRNNRVSAVVLLENASTKDNQGIEAVIARSGFEKKVNRLAKNGYQILFSGSNGIEKYALMEKQGRSPGFYSWVNLDGNGNFVSRPDLLVREGNFHLVNYGIRGCDLVATELVFGTINKIGHGESETKLLPLQDSYAKWSSDETRSRLTDLSNQGFKVRDMFYRNGGYLILEKTAH